VTKKRMNILIGIILTLIAVFIVEFSIFISTEKTVKKKIVYAQADGGALEKIQAVEIPEKNERTGISTVDLYIEPSANTNLSKYSKTQCLYVNDMNADKIKGIDGLQTYYISLTNVTDFDLSKLDLSRVVAISMDNSTVKDIEVMGQMPHLKTISMASQDVSNLDFIKNIESLDSLNIENCRVDDFAPIGEVNKIDRLTINKCGLEDGSFLENCDIRELCLNDNNLTDISFVKNMKNITRVEASNNAIVGPVDLSSADRLTYIDLSFNKITDFSCDFSSVGAVDISYNSINRISDDLLKKLDKITDGDSLYSLELFGNILENCSELKKYEFVSFFDEKGVDFTCEQYEEYCAAVRSIVDECVDSDWTDTKKAIAVFDYISDNVKYDWNLPKDDPYPYNHISHTEYSALVKNVAVCDGFSFAYRDVMRYLGIDCRVYHGDVESTTDNAAHAWNQIKLDGDWYHCDLTWQINLKENDVSDIRHFGKSDSQMERNSYFLLEEDAPECSKSISGEVVNEIVSEVRTYWE